MAAIKIKLVVDRLQKQVLFADAGSDFVDVLLTFLTLPLSSIQLVAGASSPDCLSNLCASVQHLGDNELLNGEVHSFSLLTVFSVSRGTSGTEPVWFQASTSNVLSILSGFGAEGIKGAYEVDVNIGWAEVASMLKTCVSSTTIFTDVLLTKGTDSGAVRPALLINRSLLTIHRPQGQETNVACPPISIKLFYDRQDRKVMYAECKHDFVDLLLSFLTYPMGCVVKNLAGTSHVCGSFNNLYSSAASLDAAGFLKGACFGHKNTLLDPSLAPFKTRSNDSGKSASAVSVLKHWCKRDWGKVGEMNIAITKQEAVALLRAVVNSKTALTDAFKERINGPWLIVAFTGKPPSMLRVVQPP
ncbi:uncharacterized protein [Lolium perenne]|uniref:uncharacterized protein n=1 Tax=Lolium perenne TaxID=4522 RepID=UPI0021F67697|nr:uncharacterized protein LOC127339999 [Lolium perenne]